MSFGKRIDQLEQKFGVREPEAHPDFLRDEALLVGINPNCVDPDAPEDVKEAHSRKQLRFDLVQFGGLTKEDVRFLSNEQLKQTFWNNRGCMVNLCRRCLRHFKIITANGNFSHTEVNRSIAQARSLIRHFEGFPALGECPPELVALANREIFDE